MNGRRTRAAAGAVLALALALASRPAAAAERAELFDEAERARALVARLTSPGGEGAGIVVHVDERYLYGVTARHVVYVPGPGGGPVENLEVRLRAWPNRIFDAQAEYFTGLHEGLDLGVFRADLRQLGLSVPELRRAVPLDQLGSSLALDPGDGLLAVGHASTGPWFATREEVRFVREEDRDHFLFSYACPEGHSGGGVFDDRGRLVGMMVDRALPLCRAVRIESVLRRVQRWGVDVSLVDAPAVDTDPELDRGIVVAVVDFDNRSGADLPDLGPVAQDVTSSALVTVPGVALATRDRLAAVRREISLAGTQRSAAGLSRVGRLLDVDAILTGSILRYDVERREFQGYGTSALKDTYRMTVSLQIIDVDSGRLRFSETYDVERQRTYPKATSAPRRPIDRAAELLTALLGQAEGEIKGALAQVAAGLGTAGQFVAVPVVSDPAGADVILNGVYMGSTPLTLEMTLDSHELSLELPGHESWQRRIKVRPGMTIEVNLVPELR